jgi:hypothetical protein
VAAVALKLLGVQEVLQTAEELEGSTPSDHRELETPVAVAVQVVETIATVQQVVPVWLLFDTQVAIR